jgi:hypothetical protein
MFYEHGWKFTDQSAQKYTDVARHKYKLCTLTRLRLAVQCTF